MLDPKWTGTEADRRDMRNLNLEQVVRRNFGNIAMFGFASTLLATWEAIAVSLSLTLPNGGTAGLFWNFCILSVGFGFVYASLAELGSMFPTAGGQYYWVAILAPRSYRRYLSYITGYLCAITWQTGVAGTAFVAGTLIQSIFVLTIKTYDPHPWHGTLLTIAFAIIAVIFNTFFARQLPMIEIVFVILHIVGVVIFIPLLAMAPKSDGGSPIVDFYNANGWASNGVATLVATVGPSAALTGFDCSVHMAEEAINSSRTVPVTLLVGYTTNVVLGFFTIMAIIYTVGPLAPVLSNPNTTGYIIIDMFYSATQSRGGATAMTTVIAMCQVISCIASLAAASRQVWAFARNRGVPFSKFFAPDRLLHDIPLNAVMLSLILSILIAFINLGSSEALGIIFSLYSSALVGSYLITISCVLLHRLQGRKLPQAGFTLGKWGILCNCIALIFVIPIFIFSFFPTAPKPTASSMNWASTLVGGIGLLATGYYIAWGRKSYSPPDETVEDYIQRSETAVKDEVGAETVPEKSVVADIKEKAEM